MNSRAIALAHTHTLDPYPIEHLDYAICRTESDMTNYLYSGSDGYHDLNPRIVIAEDTESLPDDTPFCLTFSVRPGSGRLIYVRDQLLIDRYRGFLIANRPRQIMHNYNHDSEVFDKLDLPIHHFTDTMVRAFNLCLGGGGDAEDGESRAGRGLLSLKVLAWRHCRMRMTSFSDTVHPYSVPHAIKWLEQARDLVAPLPKKMCTCGHGRDRHNDRGKTGKLKGTCTMCGACVRYKERKALKEEGSKELGLLHTKCNRLITALTNQELDPETNTVVDPWKRYKAWHDHDREALEPIIGPMPRPSIAYVPEPVLLHYAVRDADATLRMERYMRRLRPWLFYRR